MDGIFTMYFPALAQEIVTAIHNTCEYLNTLVHPIYGHLSPQPLDHLYLRFRSILNKARYIVILRCFNTSLGIFRA